MIAQTTNLEAGELAVGAGPYAAEMWLGHVTGRVLKRYPQLRLKLQAEHWRVLPELLRQGRLDLVVANVEEILGLKEFRIIEQPPVRGIWVCRASHPLTRRKALSHSALKEYPFIGLRIPEPIRVRMDSGARDASLMSRKIETTSVTLIKAMSRESDAISLVHPDMVRAEVASGEFAALEIDAPALSLRGGVVWLAERSPLAGSAGLHSRAADRGWPGP